MTHSQKLQLSLSNQNTLHMPVIKHNDSEIHYEHYDLIPHIKIFHQDYIPISAGTDYEVLADLGGQAKTDFESLKSEHISRAFIYKPFLESPPSFIPSYDFIIYEGKEKKFPFMDIMSVGGIVGPNQLIISYRLMGILQKYRMAPHITAPVVVKHRDTFIDDFYVMVHFWHHGCDLVDWESTIFAIIEPVEENYISFFQLNNLDAYLNFRSKVSKGGIHYKPISLTLKNKFDIFYSHVLLSILSTKSLLNKLSSVNIKNLSVNRIQCEILERY